ncbi:MAG: tetratricopeptide repeat protein [Sphaerochaetaceae bacterium]|jgi:tetratricopeptide (TPR) repeat protein|nr:tetratricopeptide repeat protein [Sphaerochaetaceae bacterium]NLO61617.1 tetratricopeptide repeat protein [Spirochaetales bacterium]MDD2406854.1 tetratricopeptide repeat protein [Sphaerochaetaceae bacterium]MDD3670733.1 tetratricopeptide repeat protein [Sphaerochaetaceae bacterium]MDD4260525.1 tetratricopeptide repeat protein [Sphaerochaetaceae bacterium]
MAKENEKDISGKVESTLNSFITRHRLVLIIIGVAIVLALIGLWIGLGVSANITEANQLKIDTLQVEYDTWAALEDKTTDEANASLTSLKDDLAELSRKGKKYPALKALYLLGMIEFNHEKYQEAHDYFIEASNKAGTSFLASLSLMNAAVCIEMSGDSVKALDMYQAVYDRFGTDAPEAPKALFNVARLHEAANNLELARAIFQQLADEFPSSEYAKLAQSRLVTLQ